MNLKKILSISVLFTIVFGVIIVWKQSSENSDLIVPETAIHDLNDFRIMLYLDREREYALNSAGEIPEIDYSSIEDRSNYEDSWGVIRGGIEDWLLLHPTSKSGFYYIYRELENSISQAKGDGRSVEFSVQEAQYLIALMGSSMKLALQEKNQSIYSSILDTQNCLISEAITGDLLTFDLTCFPNLKADVYRELNLAEN